MPISRENVPQSTGNTPPYGNASSTIGTNSSRPSGVAGNLPSCRPTGVTDGNSTQDEMKYGRIVRIIKATPKDKAVGV